MFREVYRVDTLHLLGDGHGVVCFYLLLQRNKFEGLGFPCHAIAFPYNHGAFH